MSEVRSPPGSRRPATASTANRSTTTTSPRLIRHPGIPAENGERHGQPFNACAYLLDQRLADGDGQRIALAGAARELSYAQLHDQVCRTAAGLRALGLHPEQCVLMLMADSPQFVVVYLAAMRMGAIPVPVSTMLHADGVAELLNDSRPRCWPSPGSSPRPPSRPRRRRRS